MEWVYIPRGDHWVLQEGDKEVCVVDRVDTPQMWYLLHACSRFDEATALLEKIKAADDVKGGFTPEFRAHLHRFLGYPRQP